eukprot:jgi/Antlo1/331/1657
MLAYIASMAAILLCMLVVLHRVSQIEPLHMIMYSKSSHSREYTKQGVSVSLMAILFAVPVAAAGVANCRVSGRAQTLAATMVSFWVAQCMASLVSEIIKLVVGECRPDYYSRHCGINPLNNCDRHILSDGMKSFPSGHTAIAFCSATFAVLLVHSALCACLHRPWRILLSYVLGALLFGIAFFVGLLRIWTNKHFVHDVAAGALIGVVVGAANHMLMVHFVKRHEQPPK